MPINLETLILFFVAFFSIAALYSSVGFGGGSSYLALLSVFGFSFFFIRSNALLCNLLVVSASSYLFYIKTQVSLKSFFPFVVVSIPMAFIGALFKLEEKVFFVVLGVTLIFSGFSLLYQAFQTKVYKVKRYPKYMSYLLGGILGFISGLVGIGGGIFLAPLLSHLNWGKPIKIAALASFFILVNSISGLLGLYVNNTLEFSWSITIVLLLAVFLGGQLGVRFTIKKASPKAIRVGTAILVLIVGCRILLVKGL